MGFFISQQGLNNFANWKYSGVDNSILAKYVGQPWWTWVVSKCPLWVAPNLITFIGFCFVLTQFFLTIYYLPLLSSFAPTWLYYSAAACLFIYQTLDAIDGKQARRTGTSSPLGQLFDHGCDSMHAGLGVITGAAISNMGATWSSILCIICSCAVFYCTTWEEYHTHTLYLGYINGVDEGLVAFMIMYLATGWLGPSIWLKPVTDVYPSWFASFFPTGTLMNESMVYSLIVLALGQIGMNIHSALTAIQRQNETSSSSSHLISSNAHITNTIPAALLRLAPYAAMITGFCTWTSLHWSTYQEYPVLFLVCFSLLHNYLTMRIILAGMAKLEFELVYYSLAPLVLLPWLSETSHTLSSTYTDSALGLFLFTAVLVAQFFFFSASVIQDICSHLKIQCFRIPYTPSTNKLN